MIESLYICVFVKKNEKRLNSFLVGILYTSESSNILSFLESFLAEKFESSQIGFWFEAEI